MAQLITQHPYAQKVDLDCVARGLYRPDIWRDAALSVGLNVYKADEKPEGGHANPYEIAASPSSVSLPPNRFFDGGQFIV